MKEIHTPPEHLYDNHSYKTTIAVGFGIALPVIAIPLRLWARRIQGLQLKGDDYAIIIAAILTIGNSCVPILADNNGNGRHEETLTKENLKNYFLALFIFEQTFGVAVAAVKISILLLCRRIFVTRIFRISTTILMFLILAWVLVKNLVGAFQCTPVKKAWLKKTPGHCINFIDLVIYAQACNIIFDIAILILPLREIYKLQLSPLKKVGVMAIFAVGSFSIISAIVRIAVIASEVNEYGRSLPDVTWFTSKWTWTVLDPAVGCFAACMPTWVPLIRPLARVGEYASLLGSRLRSTLSRSTHRSAVKLNEEPVNGNEHNYYLAGYKQPTQRDVEVQVTGGKRSESESSGRDLYPLTNLSEVEQPSGGVKVKREFRQEEYKRDSL